MRGIHVLFIFFVLLSSGLAGARTVELQGSANIENGLTGKARALAIQNALTQAAMYGKATVQGQTQISNNTITLDATRVSSSGVVGNVRVLDEWQEKNVYHVLVSADVSAGKVNKTANTYRKKIAVTQFEVLGRASMQDLPALEINYPKLLLGKLEEKGGIVAIDATHYLMSAHENRQFRQGDPPDRRTVIKLARELGVQFLVTGIFHNMSWQRDGLGMQRNVVMELQILDGMTGMAIGRYTFSETLWGGQDVLAQAEFGSETFSASTLGKLLHTMMSKQLSLVRRDVGEMPFSARVIRSEGKKVYFDAGSASQVSVGDVFMAYTSDYTVSTLLNRQFLGQNEQAMATLVVKKVQPLFAMGELETDAGDLKPGDIVRITW